MFYLSTKTLIKLFCQTPLAKKKFSNHKHKLLFLIKSDTRNIINTFALTCENAPARLNEQGFYRTHLERLNVKENAHMKWNEKYT